MSWVSSKVRIFVTLWKNLSIMPLGIFLVLFVAISIIIYIKWPRTEAKGQTPEVSSAGEDC